MRLLSHLQQAHMHIPQVFTTAELLQQHDATNRANAAIESSFDSRNASQDAAATACN